MDMALLFSSRPDSCDEAVVFHILDVAITDDMDQDVPRWRMPDVFANA